MVELYWPRNTTFSVSTPSGVEQYQPGLHDIDEEHAERFKNRGWVDPSDDDVDVEIERDDATVVVEDEDDGQEEEVDLDEDELSLTSNEPDLEDDTDDQTESERAAAEADADADADADDGDDSDEDVEDEFDAQSFVDRTPQREVINDIETGEYDEYLEEIADAEESGRDRRGVASAIESRRDED